MGMLWWDTDTSIIYLIPDKKYIISDHPDENIITFRYYSKTDERNQFNFQNTDTCKILNDNTHANRNNVLACLFYNHFMTCKHFDKQTSRWDLAPVPLKINVMTFSKSHDIKVMTLVFRPTKQMSWHSASNVMTLISWHWGVDIRLKVNFWCRWRKIITIHAVCIC